MLSILLGLVLAPAQVKPFDFYGLGPYNGKVPKPESMLGYGPGEWHTTYRDQERVVDALVAAAPERLKKIEFGKSAEGRPLRIVVAASAENMKRIEDIRRAAATVADPTDRAKAEAAARSLPAIVWINQCIHGSETASAESAMWLLYTLGASRHETIERILKDAVVIVNPMYNPDGHERHVVWYNSVATGSEVRNAVERRAPDSVYGRVSRYRFDMNRDRVAMSQDETRAEVAEFLRWNPHVYVDQHGQTSNYFFPPNPMAINANVGRERLNRWTNVFGRAIGKAFDDHSWLYFIKEEFDLYYAGYLDSWTALSGAIGMTFEADGGAFLRTRRADGSILTLRDGVEKHFVSALTTAKAAAEGRAELVASYLDFKTQAVNGRHAGDFQRVIVASDDPRPLQRFKEQLDLHGIRSSFVGRSFEQPGARDFWSNSVGSLQVKEGSLVVDMNQSQGPLAKALLEANDTFEPEFVQRQKERRKGIPEGEEYPGPRGAEFYDITGWSMIYGHGLDAWWSDQRPAFLTGNALLTTPPRLEEGKVGWFLRTTDEDDVLAVSDLLNAGIRCHAVQEPIQVQGTTLPVGTVLILRGRNESREVGWMLDRLRDVAAKRRVKIEALNAGFPDEGAFGPGSASNRSLRQGRLGVVFGDEQGSTDYGPLWYLLERRFKIPFDPLRTNALDGDLKEYATIVLPAGRYRALSDNFKNWVRSGGCVVVLGEPGWAIGTSGLVELERAKNPDDRDSLPGSLFRAELDARSILAYGYPAKEGKARLGILASGNTFYNPRKEGGSVLRIPAPKEGDPKNLLSGWVWDDSEKRLAGTVWAHEQPYGNGRVVMFMDDPCFRAMWPGQWKMLLNAIVFGGNP